MADYCNARIRAEFGSGVAIDQFFTLDGLLGALIVRTPEYRAASRDRRRWQRYVADRGLGGARQLYAERGWPVPQERHFLPLGVWGHGRKHGLWVYASSVAIPDEPWEFDTVYWTRRMDSEAVFNFVAEDGLPNRIETGKGPYKAYHELLSLIVTRGLTWYVRGNLEQIENLLYEARYIGKKRAQGYGRVLRWTVEPMAEDWSVWRGNELMRPVPVELLELHGIRGDFISGYYSYRPPYHDARNMALCAMRGRRDAQISASAVQKPICAVELAQNAFGSG